MEGLVIDIDIFLGGDSPEIADNVRDAYAVEIISLATRKDGRQNLMLLGGSQNEDGMCRRLLKSLEEGIERGLRKHMDLVNDKHAVPSDLRRDLHLLHQCLDVIDAVVGGSVKLVDAV